MASRTTAVVSQRGHVCLQFMNKLQQLYECGHLCDLTIELRTQKLYTHKVILAAWSPAVYNLLLDTHGTETAIRIQYDDAEIFSCFLSFLYSGQIENVTEQNLIQVLHLATSLQVSDLRQVCEEVLQRQVQIDNIISSFHVARKFRLPNLEEYALNYMQMNLPEAVKQADFLSLSPTRFNSFLSSGWVCIMKPEVKLFLIISWLGYDVKERQQYLVLLLKHIDWSTVANDFLNEISQTENFFTTNESSLYLLLQTLFSSMIPLGPYTDSFPALREKYGYLLDDVVQHSYVLPVEAEEYFPVAFHLVPPITQTSSEHQNAPVGGGELSGAGWVKQQDENPSSIDAVGSDVEVSFSQSDMHELSNDSVTTGIGLGMRKVAIVESHPAPSAGAVRFNEGEASFTTFRHQDQASTIIPVGQAGLVVNTSTDSVKSASPPRHPLSSQSGDTKTRRSPAKGKQRPRSQKPVKTDTAAASRKRGTKKCSVADEISPVKFPTPDKEKLNKGRTAQCEAESGNVGEESFSKSVLSHSLSDSRPKRQAAAKFTVPEKLIPRLRKTKALLKEVLVPPEDVKETQNHAEEQVPAQDSTHRSSDSEDDGGKDFDEDSDKDPDYNVPQKRPRTSKPVGKVSNETKSGKTVNQTKARNSGTDGFTSMKRNTSESSPKAPQNISTNSDAACIKSCQDPDTEEKERKEDSQAKRKCLECDYTAPTQRRLLNHMERVHGSKATLYACTLCQFECQWNKLFYIHMKQHFMGPPYQCEFDGCGFEAERIQVLLIHRRRHTDERPHKCPHCSARFRTRNNLIAHFKCHSDDKAHECPVCHRRFRMKNTMEQHLVTHSDLRPYLCDTCGFSTKFQSHLISHKRIHTGEVFTCSIINCNYSSPKRSQLKAHMRSHLNIRHHKCEVCQKMFVEKSHLVRHLKIHQDVRPHKCDQCEYSSTRVDKVNEHKRKYHSEDGDSKRQYKYIPRSKKGEKKPSAKPSAPLPSPAMAVIASTGRPIQPKASEQDTIAAPKDTTRRRSARPKKSKQLNTLSPIETLVSAAEMIAKTNQDSSLVALNGDKATLAEESSKGQIQISISCGSGAGGVKDEPLLEPNLVVDLEKMVDKDRTWIPGLLHAVAGAGDGSCSTTATGSRDQNIMDQSRLAGGQSNSMLFGKDVRPQQTLYSTAAAHPTHASAALLQQLALSASSAGSGLQSVPHATQQGKQGGILSQRLLKKSETGPSIFLPSIQQHGAATYTTGEGLTSLTQRVGLGALPGQPGLGQSKGQVKFTYHKAGGIPMNPGDLLQQQVPGRHQHFSTQQAMQQPQDNSDGAQSFL